MAEIDVCGYVSKVARKVSVRIGEIKKTLYSKTKSTAKKQLRRPLLLIKKLFFNIAQRLLENIEVELNGLIFYARARGNTDVEPVTSRDNIKFTYVSADQEAF